MDKIGIIGLGLIGGSLAKALKRTGGYNIVAYDTSAATLAQAYNDKVIDGYSEEIGDIFSDSKVIFICTPIEYICGCIEKLMAIAGSAILTDVGGTKYNLSEKIKNYKNVRFIGGHPMAGSESSGYQASKEFLFENAYYVLVPSKNTNDSDFDYLTGIIKKIGALPITLNPKLHDSIVSAISHLPHIIAASLVNCVHKIETNNNYVHQLAAGGFKDITRIASSSPNIWNSVCIDNKTEIIKILELFKSELSKFEASLLSGDVYSFFEESKQYRDSFSSQKRAGLFMFYELKVDILDKPGSIATISTMLSVNGINIKNIGIINSREFENGILSINFDSQKDMDNSRALLKEMNYNVYG
ncbi:MAG: prephenate dehydrogenase/arogenate dehydrogenase family protein [Clostridiales bacterium]|jgi:prephenate dehydrogenase|nr:prephenate dehydrogenase/arogenate dehydrogenase family protein [Clostridiales bacterium]